MQTNDYGVFIIVSGTVKFDMKHKWNVVFSSFPIAAGFWIPKAKFPAQDIAFIFFLWVHVILLYCCLWKCLHLHGTWFVLTLRNTVQGQLGTLFALLLLATDHETIIAPHTTHCLILVLCCLVCNALWRAVWSTRF